MLHPFEYRIRQDIVRAALPVGGSRLLLGVSGGADSMALLQVLAALQNDLSCTLVAAYIDHGLRPGETPDEWSCVRKAAALLGIECARLSVDVGAIAAAERLSLEHAAREARYRAFAELAGQWSTDLLAVAHTADDQAEEILLRLFRGGGGKALAGMRMRSGHIVRPLLGVRKRELLAYLADKGVGFCHDSSNDDRRFLRNRVRLDLLPLLESAYDPGVRAALLKTAANLGEDEDLLESLLAEQWAAAVEPYSPDADGPGACRLDRAAFRRLHPALQRRLLERLLWQLGTPARYRQILSLLAAAVSGQTGSELHLSCGLRVAVHRDHLIFSFPKGQGPWRGRLT
ncbi:MAG: tRNA lysidine(34) synthetase TilS [Desulfobulbus sp.]|uniref:tRNA lysidine(34) synthetase TilS n=1 Tax=Desulfobulbus sp. TaxID=895 RepID=UPI00283F5641|nr:tRNA lysidine(34) synthetase TilS [Desulfobulbus sp.]MDR2550287.1 tRNA lysidine(34) synthetase TilS [Desulfobulbus sp.]